MMVTTNSHVKNLKIDFINKHFDEIIKNVRKLVRRDKSHLADPFIKQWCQLRWRSLFLQEASRYESAIKESSHNLLVNRILDRRSDLQKLSDRFFDNETWDHSLALMPEASVPQNNRSVLVFCPNLLTGLVKVYEHAFADLNKRYSTKIIRTPVHPIRSSKDNIADLHKTFTKSEGLDIYGNSITNKNPKPLNDIWIITYSKGICDLLDYLIAYPQILPKIKCIFNIAGPVYGSFIADRLHEKYQHSTFSQKRVQIGDFLSQMFPAYASIRQEYRIREYDLKGALKELTSDYRKSFQKKHRQFFYQMGIPVFNISGKTQILDIPPISIPDFIRIHKFSKDHDMQVTVEQSRLSTPLSIDLPVVRAHHWDIACDPIEEGWMKYMPNSHLPFPKEALIASIYQLARELGLIS